MKFLIMLMLIVSCDRDCDVTCYGTKDNCTVRYSGTGANYSYLSSMKAVEANNFCIEFNGVQKYHKK
jgi:hypothetical protein